MDVAEGKWDISGGWGRYWLRGLDLNQRPLGYEPNELPDCSTPQLDSNNHRGQGQTRPSPLEARVGELFSSGSGWVVIWRRSAYSG